MALDLRFERDLCAIFEFLCCGRSGFPEVPLLAVSSPTQSEPPFLAAQVVLLAVFVVLGFFSVKRFHPSSPAKDIKTALVVADAR